MLQTSYIPPYPIQHGASNNSRTQKHWPRLKSVNYILISVQRLPHFLFPFDFGLGFLLPGFLSRECCALGREVWCIYSIKVSYLVWLFPSILLFRLLDKVSMVTGAVSSSPPPQFMVSLLTTRELSIRAYVVLIDLHRPFYIRGMMDALIS